MDSIQKKQSEAYEPKMNNRFMIEFQPPFDIKSYVVHGTQRPVYIFHDNEIQYERMHFRLFDPIAPSATREIMEGIRTNHDAKNNQEIKFRLKMLGPVGDVIEEWDIKGNLTFIDFGKLSWDDERSTVIEMEIQPTDVILEY